MASNQRDLFTLLEQESESDLQPERLPIPNLEDPIEDCDFPLGSSSEDIKMGKKKLQ